MNYEKNSKKKINSTIIRFLLIVSILSIRSIKSTKINYALYDFLESEVEGENTHRKSKLATYKPTYLSTY
jgi:hypothetical protein